MNLSNSNSLHDSPNVLDLYSFLRLHLERGRLLRRPIHAFGRLVLSRLMLMQLDVDEHGKQADIVR